MKIEEAIDGAPEMGSVADVVGIALGHIPAIEQVERREDVAGHGDGNQVDVDAHLGLEKDAGKKDGRYGSRGTYGAVIPVITVLNQIPDGGYYDGCQV